MLGGRDQQGRRPCRCAAPAIPKARFAMERVLDAHRARARARPRRGAAAQSGAGRADALRDADARRAPARRSRSTAATFPRCQRARAAKRSTMRVLPRASASARARGPLARHRHRQRHQGHRPRPVRIRRSCASAAPAGSRSTPARCRWGRASRPRWRRSAPSSSACAPDDVTVVAGDTAVIPLRPGRLRQPPDR